MRVEILAVDVTDVYGLSSVPSELVGAGSADTQGGVRALKGGKKVSLGCGKIDEAGWCYTCDYYYLPFDSPAQRLKNASVRIMPGSGRTALQSRRQLGGFLADFRSHSHSRFQASHGLMRWAGAARSFGIIAASVWRPCQYLRYMTGQS